MIESVEGKIYKLTFEESEEGKAESQGEWPATLVAQCVDAKDGYLCFETSFVDESSAQEGVEFFLHPEDCMNLECKKGGEWWDENMWSRLVSAEEVQNADH